MVKMNPQYEGRNGQIWKMFVSGYTQEAIAEELGLSQSGISRILKAVRESLSEPDRLELRQIHIEQLGVLTQLSARLTNLKPSPAFSTSGKPLEYTDENGVERYVEDYTAILNGAKLALSIQERAAKLMGLDAPAKSEVTIHGEDEASALLAKEALKRLNGEEEDGDEA